MTTTALPRPATRARYRPRRAAAGALIAGAVGPRTPAHAKVAKRNTLTAAAHRHALMVAMKRAAAGVGTPHAMRVSPTAGVALVTKYVPGWPDV